ncbi:MAG TPA: 30S ribosomal protein S14 [Ignavibacteria bacterium]|nr:30S ribosomal protein S14 [Bacteroidota bacterium]HRE12092.1 30S ribosomal protein S14 [Ignavibacteria bacterium]HRF66574.1 30S ribosomal protein S14 [Ignavibacteria bacterium]HRJ03697.1 30S ribosomal protein S14 [Ignavibacteria bacterium]HRJ84804.1 30S ribosomal protein S14 [Ignavibacteria bacterium]
MAKTSQVARENKRKKLVEKYAEKRKALKASGDYDALTELPRNSNPIRLHNRCAITGRARGFYRKFGISRLTFRKMALEGKIPGVKKASW